MGCGSRQPVQEMKRVQVHHAKRSRDALPVRLIGSSRARQEDTQRQRARETETRPGTGPASIGPRRNAAPQPKARPEATKTER